MTRAAVVGCGKVAQHHLKFLTELEDCTVVGLADVNLENARSLAAKFRVEHIFTSLQELLDSTRPHVLHILTPPSCHYSQAVAAIERGISILVEKPVAFRACEVADLYHRAAARGVSLCPDFNLLFHSCTAEVLAILESGQLGSVIHCYCNHSFDLETPELREAVCLNWAYDLPGGILHNYISHPLYMVLNWVGMPQRLTVSPRAFGKLPQGLTDHLDILLEGNRVTGHVVISLVAKPRAYYIQLFCEKGSILADFETLTVRVDRESFLPREINRAATSFRQAYQLSKGTLRNVGAALRGKLVPYQGLRKLIQEFYASIHDKTPPPIRKELALAVGEVEDALWAKAGKLHLNLTCRASSQAKTDRSGRVMVTGAAGYIGSEIARQLANSGYFVRAFVRPLSHTEQLEGLGAELVFGDVRDYDSVKKAAKGIDIIVHAAAALRGSRNFIVESAVTGTKNIAEAAKANGVRRVIYVSSMSVYDFPASRNGTRLTESSPLEARPEERGVSSMAKRRAEDIALAHLHEAQPPWTIIRPSIIFGNGRRIDPAPGLRVGHTLICLSGASKPLRLVHVRDVANAIVKIIEHPSTEGCVFNVSHEDVLSLKNCLESSVPKSANDRNRVIYIPYWMVSTAAFGTRLAHRIFGRGPNISQRQVRYLYNSAHVDSEAIRKHTGWQPSGRLCDQLAGEFSAGKEIPDIQPNRSTPGCEPFAAGRGTNDTKPCTWNK